MILMDPNITRLQDLEGTVLSRQVTLWVTNMINKGFFVVPRWIEMQESGDQSTSLTTFADKSIGMTSIMQKAVKGIGYLKRENDPLLPTQVELITAAKESRGVPHRVLGGAIASFRQPTKTVFWSKWHKTGITIFLKFKKCWVVFDHEKGSISSPLTNKETLTIKNETLLYIEIPNSIGGNGPFLQVYLEFENAAELKLFHDLWKKLTKNVEKFKVGSGGSSLGKTGDSANESNEQDLDFEPGGDLVNKFTLETVAE
ncbi:hypothetical protein HDU76_011144 [Blyttiomyces sp. JEL0837]|nr:hypothetical protein HDU76_011144 [Blyttiomyces sp. JEL0837]